MVRLVRLVRLASLTCEDRNSTARQGQGSGQKATLGLKRRLERGVQSVGTPLWAGRQCGQCGVRWASVDCVGNFCPSAFISAGRKTKAQNHHITLASPRFAPDRSGRKASSALPTGTLRARDSRVSRVCRAASPVWLPKPDNVPAGRLPLPNTEWRPSRLACDRSKELEEHVFRDPSGGATHARIR